jgi:vacuolar-type H+-ATPase subunit H
VLADAKQRSEHMVSESYIVQEAVEEANTLVRNAETEARRIRLEAEDFAERHLAEAEQVLGELLRYVREARAELHQTLPPQPEPPISQ